MEAATLPIRGQQRFRSNLECGQGMRRSSSLAGAISHARRLVSSKPEASESKASTHMYNCRRARFGAPVTWPHIGGNEDSTLLHRRIHIANLNGYVHVALNKVAARRRARKSQALAKKLPRTHRTTQLPRYRRESRGARLYRAHLSEKYGETSSGVTSGHMYTSSWRDQLHPGSRLMVGAFPRMACNLQP